MQILRPQFTGYFAAPLKRVYFQPNWRDAYMNIADDFITQTQDLSVEPKVHLKDGFYTKTRYIPLDMLERAHDMQWAQDNVWILEENGKTVVGRPGFSHAQESAPTLAKTLNLPLKDMQSMVVGGNCFIGKRPDGRKFALMGRETLTFTAFNIAARQLGHPIPPGKVQPFPREERPAAFAKIKQLADTASIQAEALGLIQADLGIPAEDIQIISQPEFHIDMMVRPLAYPKVLVQDFRLGETLLSLALQDEKYAESSHIKGIELEEFPQRTRQYENNLQGRTERPLSTPDEVAAELQALGYEVVRIPAVFDGRSQSINFANAVVHQQPNGKLVYITNASTLDSLNRRFAEYLQAQCPEVETVKFIAGERNGAFNDVSSKLKRVNGGVHCLSAEHPDFEAWG